MKHDILYISIFLDKKSQSNLKQWFMLNKKKKLLKKECADIAILHIIKKKVDTTFLSDKNIGKDVELKVVGLFDEEDVQIALCTVNPAAKIDHRTVKIVISSNLSKVNLSHYKNEKFIEKDGPILYGKVGILTADRKSLLEIADVYKDL